MGMVMRITFITNNPADGTTGLTRYSKVLYRELQRSGIDVGVAQPKVPLSEVLTPWGQKFDLDPVTFFSNYPVSIENSPADVFHLASESLASLLMFKRLHPVIVTVHGFFTYFLRDDPDLSMLNHRFHSLFDSLAARGLKRADAIIAVSQYVADLLTNKLGIQSDRVHVIHEGVDHEFFRPLEVPIAFWEKYGLDSHHFYFLYVGSEQPRKNFLMLVKAFARVRAKHRQIRLLKIGAPEVETERRRAEELISRLGIANDVIFVGHVGNELPLFYNASIVFIFPSFYEGFGFPPLEAMACGTPVICSNATSLPEVVGDAALLFDPSNEDQLVEQMECLLTDGIKRAEYINRGKINVNRFHWSTTAKKTLDIYREMIK